MTDHTVLDSNLSLRPGRWTDINAISNLAQYVAEFEGDSLFVLTADELANEWKSENFNVEHDVFVVETSDGHLVGSEEFYSEGGHCKLIADGCVHPDFRRKGIGSSLLDRIAERARTEIALAASDQRVYLQSSVNNKDEAGHELLRNHGFTLIRYHWRMEIKLPDAPSGVLFPQGIELRSFIKAEHASAVWQANNESFLDHWGSHEQSFESWSHAKFGNPNFDPNLWLIAWDGNEVAGFSLNRFRKGIGWIGTLAVRRFWRRKGLGFALLRQSFNHFYNLGMPTIGLGVDSANLTGATRLYQRAGMVAVGEYATYEKELRPGIG